MADEMRGSGAADAGMPTEPTGPGGAGRRKGRRAGLLILLGIIIIGGLGGAYWYVRLRGVVSTDDAYVDGNRATVTTKILGRIDTLGADDGDTVQAGQLLVKLDDSDLRARLAQAESQLDLAQKNVRLAVVDEQKARDDYRRDSVQLGGNAISREQFEHARTALEAAEAGHQIALAKVATARSGLAVIQQQIADTRVTAPFRGVVAKRWLLPGDVVAPGQPVFTLYDIDSVWVTAVFEETKLRFMPMGTRARLSVDAYPGRTFHGRVILIGAAAASQFSLIPPNNASGNFTKVTQRIPVRFSIAPDAGAPPVRLLPGMSVEVTLEKPGT